MNESRRRQLLWCAVIGGGLLVAIFFVSALAPSAKPSGDGPVIRTAAEADLATLTGDSTTTSSTTAKTETTPGGFSMGGGEIFDLAWRLVLVVIVIAVSIFGLRWWTRRTAGPRSTSGLLRVVDTLAVGTGRSIHLVSIGERVIVVGATTQQLSFLNELTEDEAVQLRTKSTSGAEPHLATFAAELFQSMRKPSGGRENQTRREVQQ
jgi:flagellar protein FliO/FliZ